MKGREKPFFGTFRLHPPRDGEVEQEWAVYPPNRDGETPEMNDLVAKIEHLPDADRTSVEKVRQALGGRNSVIAEALKIWRYQTGTAPGTGADRVMAPSHREIIAS